MVKLQNSEKQRKFILVKIIFLGVFILDLQAFNQEINIKHKKHFVSILNQIKMCRGQTSFD